MRSLSKTVSSDSTYTVLIVDDFQANRELYRHCLLADSNYRYRLLEADSATAAVSICQSNQIDGILVDETLPDATGVEFVRELQTQSDGFHPPVVMVTSEQHSGVPTAIAVQHAVRVIKQGVEDYLVRQNLTAEQLQVAMRSAIENARLRLQLQHNEERFRVSIENMLDCFGIFSTVRDASGTILDFQIDYLNAAALEANRMTEGAFGRGLCELLPAHRETGLFAEYCRVVETGEPLTKEQLVYSDHYGAEFLTRAFDVHISKLDDGFVAS